MQESNWLNRTIKSNISKYRSFNRTFYTKVKASYRIGPDNEDIIFILTGSLLGDGYANLRTIEGTKFC